MKCLSYSVLMAAASLSPIAVMAENDVYGGSLFTLTNTAFAPNGVWSWFEDERAIIDASDPNNPLLLASSVSYAGGGSERGDIDLLWRNLAIGAQGTFELHDQLEPDDHDSAALYQRADGRYLAMYSRHGNDPLTRWRISVNPNDPTSWGPEQTLNNGAGTTYNNTYFLPNDNGGAGRLYNFTRTNNYDPNVQVSSDQGSTWANAGKLLTEGGGGDRPYVRYASDGKKIHFIATDRHPRNFANSIYHGYVQDGQLFHTDGTLVDADVFDGSGVAPRQLTRVFGNGSQFGGTTMNRAWTISMEIDNTGNPVAIFSARANDDDDDHRFFYARHDGADWRVHEMAEAGGFLYQAENDYTGLASIDPNNPNVVYMSSEIDPVTGVGTTSGKYELYKGVTSDFGASWSWSPITADSTIDNLRPVVPAWDGENTAVTWLRGNYNTYTNWDTEVVGISFATTDAKSQLWRGTGGAGWDIQATRNWDSGGGTAVDYHDGDEVAFDDSASSFSIDITAGGVSPSGVAFNNSAANPYTVTGGGIAGAGALRVIGGGAVTLNNTDNPYTGDTLIARGTLALAGSAALSGTPHIDIRGGGTLDVSAVSGGGYTLAGQTLTIAGEVQGNIHATAGSAVHLESSNSLHGDLTLADAVAEGAGRVTGDLVAQAGAVIQVGGDGLSPVITTGTTTYVDANAGTNTTLANGSALPTTPNDIANDNRWRVRTFGNNGSIFESNGNAASGEDAPMMRTRIDSLTPGDEVTVFAYFWGATGGNWRGRAEVSDTQPAPEIQGYNSVHFAASSMLPMDGPLDAAGLVGDGQNPVGVARTAGSSGDIGSNNANWFSADTFDTPVFMGEDNRYLVQVTLGTVTVDANGQVDVYIDDLADTGQENRTWYDGVGYRSTAGDLVVPEVVSFMVDGSASFDAGSTLSLDIYSPEVLDRLDVAQALHAAGTLEVKLADGAPQPQLGDRFEVLRFDTLAGSFQVLDLPALGAGLYWSMTDLYAAGSLTVVDAAPVLGDTDGDGDIDNSDLQSAIANFTGPLTPGVGGKNVLSGDADSDGDIDNSDLQAAIANFTGPVDVASVPEPGTAMVLLLGGMTLLRGAPWRH